MPGLSRAKSTVSLFLAKDNNHSIGKGSSLEFQQTAVAVNSGEYSGLVDNMGNFKIQVPSAGTYKVEVYNPHFFFEPVVVEISEEEFSPGKDTKAFLYSLKSGKDFRLMYPLVLDPTSRLQYFEPAPQIDPL